nr:hypothetical protein BaRGS_022016 [Batillaria attramentaria]
MDGYDVEIIRVPNPFQPKIVLHEIGHALGLIHEHQRPDRDQYIAINRENIRPGRQRDFERFGPARVQNLGVGYDYMSIMHYGQTVKPWRCHHCLVQNLQLELDTPES